jgi:drug/metabolite transporter (DMT)-like permease
LTDVANQRRQRLIGIALMCGAVACFSCLDATAKYLNTQMDTLQIVWARYVSSFVFALLIANPVSNPALMITRRPWLQGIRSLLLLGSTLLNFLALRWLQLDQTTSILFCTPFLVAALSGPILDEWVGWRRWIAISVGFIGVLLVTRPGVGGIHVAALLTFASAICYAVYIISTRILSRTDSNVTTLFYSNVVGAVVMTFVVPFVWSTPRSALVAALMALTGALGGFGHYLLIIAHRLAPPAVLAPFMYTQLIWVIALGFLIFADLPSLWTVAGASIVVASGLYLLHRERQVGKRTRSGGLLD